jgi:integrase
MKKGVGRMAIPIHPDWRQSLVLWLAKLQQSGYLRPGIPLSLSRKHPAGCHSYRRWFRVRVYQETKQDLIKTQRIMGHKEVSSTQTYLQSIADDADLETIILRAA